MQYSQYEAWILYRVMTLRDSVLFSNSTPPLNRREFQFHYCIAATLISTYPLNRWKVMNSWFLEFKSCFHPREGFQWKLSSMTPKLGYWTSPLFVVFRQNIADNKLTNHHLGRELNKPQNISHDVPIGNKKSFNWSKTQHSRWFKCTVELKEYSDLFPRADDSEATVSRSLA